MHHQRPTHPRSTRPALLLVILTALALLMSACAIEVPPPDEIIGGGPAPTAPDPGGDDGGRDGQGGGDEGSGSNDGGGNDGGGNGSDDPPPAVQDRAIDERLRGFTTWDAPVHESVDSRDLGVKTFSSGGFDYSCQVDGERDLAPPAFDQFAAFAFDGDLLPGLLVEGSGVLHGDLRAVPVDRAPLTLTMDLASANPTAVVDNPTSSDLTTAVANLKADADARLSGIDVVPAQIDLRLETTSSYEEALLQMGVSLRYDSPDLSAAFSSQFDQTETRTEHSVTMRLLQPMFTVRVDQSQIQTPGQYLATDATVGQLDRLVADGKLGAGNPPVLIDSVTYGRSVYFTFSSTEVDSAEELRVAVEGAYGGFSGDASVATAHRTLVESASPGYRAYGGDQEVALNAMRAGQIQEFLRKVNTSNAIPLTFTMRTLDGTKVDVQDRATIKDIGCTKTPVPTRTTWAVEVKTANAWVNIYVDGTHIAEIDRHSNFTTVDITNYINEGKLNDIDLHVYPTACVWANPGVIAYVVRDGTRLEGRKQDSDSCQWWSTWKINDGNNQVTGPPNWTTRP